MKRKEMLRKIEKMLDEKLSKTLAGLREAILTPEEDKVQRQWDKIYNKKLREMGFKIK